MVNKGKSIPFIHVFRTSVGNYFYDVNKNEIVKISEETFEILSKCEKHNMIDERFYCNSEIKHLINRGYLRSDKVMVSKHPDLDYIQFFLQNHLDTLLLQVSQGCNLRCGYCIYSGEYDNRTHQNKMMSWDTAKRSIDFIVERSADCKTLYFGFYGGEPLCNFSLIKKCIEYIKQVCTDKALYLNITTNGTLLSEDISEYFVKNNVSIMVSLDGPRDVHDASRRYAISNKGSFDDVWNNIKYLYENHPEYYREMVHFNTVLNSEGYKTVEEFFSNEPMLSDSVITSSFISNNYSKKANSVSNKFMGEYSYNEFVCFLSRLGLINEIPHKLLDLKFLRICELDERLGGREFLPCEGHRAGGCIPGVQKLFVTVEGKFYPCERVSEIYDTTNIGNIDTGLDIDKIKALSNIQDYTFEICRECWAYSFCEICLTGVEDADGISSKKILNKCKATRCSIEDTFKDYTVLKHVGFNLDKENRKNFCLNYDFDNIDSMNYEVESQELYSISTPIVFVTGLFNGLDTNVTIRMLHKSLIEKGYKVTSFVCDFEDNDNKVFSIKHLNKIWEIPTSLGLVLNINHAIKFVEYTQDVDLILLEIPSGITQMTNKVVKCMDDYLFNAIRAVNPDCITVNIPFNNYLDCDIDYIIKDLIERYGKTFDVCNVTNKKICLEESERYNEATYLSIDREFVKTKLNDLVEENSKIVFDNGKDGDNLADTIVGILHGFYLEETSDEL